MYRFLKGCLNLGHTALPYFFEEKKSILIVKDPVSLGFFYVIMDTV